MNGQGLRGTRLVIVHTSNGLPALQRSRGLAVPPGKGLRVELPKTGPCVTGRGITRSGGTVTESGLGLVESALLRDEGKGGPLAVLVDHHLDVNV